MLVLGVSKTTSLVDGETVRMMDSAMVDDMAKRITGRIRTWKGEGWRVIFGIQEVSAFDVFLFVVVPCSSCRQYDEHARDTNCRR